MLNDFLHIKSSHTNQKKLGPGHMEIGDTCLSFLSGIFLIFMCQHHQLTMTQKIRAFSDH